MKRPLLFGLMLLSCRSFAQAPPRNLLQNRFPPETVQAALLPRSAWKPYPTTPDAWRAALPDSLRRNLIRAGEDALGAGIQPLPATLMLEYVRTGNRTRYEAASFGRRNQLMALALAEAIEGKGRFADALVNHVWAICEESFWGVPAHLGGQKTGSGLPNVEDRTVDLFVAETAATLALTDCLVGPALERVSPLVRPRIYHETALRLFEPLSREPERYGYLKKGAKVNNWNPWIMANWLTATLLLEPDASRRARLTSAAMSGLDLYLNGLGVDGGCDEGPAYWFVAGGCVFDALELLHGATGGRVDVFGEPLIRNMASYVYKMHIAGPYFVDFADADPTLQPYGLMLYRFGRKTGDDTLSRFGQWAYHQFPAALTAHSFNRQRWLLDLLTVREIGPAVSFSGVPDAWFPDVKVMTARSPKGLFLAAHGGHNAESHNHNDVGDFILYADGQPVVIDAGRGFYTAQTFSPRRYELWYTRSAFHNLPTVNGVEQKAGREFEAKNVHYRASPTQATLTMDLAAAYPAEAGIRNWNRAVQLDRRAEAVQVTDAYALTAKPTSLQQTFLTTATVETPVPGQVVFKGPHRRDVVLRYDARQWEARVEPVPLMPGGDDEGFKTKWPGQTLQRVLLTQKSPAASGRAFFRFSAR
jgi:hypothetical protein